MDLIFKHSYENINITIDIAIDTREILVGIELSSLERNHSQLSLPVGIQIWPLNMRKTEDSLIENDNQQSTLGWHL